ncbi:MAG: DNA primase [Gemmatimonadota bacterium]
MTDSRSWLVKDERVEEVRERADIVELLGEHMPLKRSGRTWRGPCPLHGGEGPNFSVDPARGLFKCFVCGEGGDVFAFFMKRLGMDFPEAVRHVAARVGVEIPEERGEREDPWGRLREVLAFAEEWFVGRLRDEAEGRAAREYLAARGFSDEDADRFGLGWAPDEWRALRDAAHARGIRDDELLEAGLLATSERAEEPYDRFRGRLIFSIHDLRDRPIAFGGRVLGPASDQVPKYINSPESPVFHKGRSLYGLVWARHEIRREEASLVAEGYMDVLALHRAGLRSAVAPLGTSLTEDQAELLARYAKRCFLLYDSDPAGLRATFRAGDALLAAGVHPMVVSLPAGEDPDSLLREGGTEALAPLLEDALDILERKLQILERQGYLDSIEGRRRAVDGLLSTLRAVRDPALRDLYLARAAERTGVRRETFVREVAREAARTTARPRAQREPEGAARRVPGGAPSTDVEAVAERSLLLLLLRDRRLVEAACARGLATDHFREPAFRSIYGALAAAGPAAGPAELAERLAPDETSRLEDLAGDATELVHPGEVFEQALRRLLNRDRLERLGQIDRELELADEDQARRLLVEKAEIARRLREEGVSLSFLTRLTGARGEPAPR